MSRLLILAYERSYQLASKAVSEIKKYGHAYYLSLYNKQAAEVCILAKVY